MQLSSQDLPNLSKKDFAQSLDCSLLQIAQNQKESKAETEKISDIIKKIENAKQKTKANYTSKSSFSLQDFVIKLNFDNAKNYLNQEIIEKRIIDSESANEQKLDEIIKQKSIAYQEIVTLEIIMNAVSNSQTEEWIKQTLNENYFKKFYKDAKKITAFTNSKKLRDIKLKKRNWFKASRNIVWINKNTKDWKN